MVRKLIIPSSVHDIRFELAKILVLYDTWMRADAEQMWRTAFNESMGEELDQHDFLYVENVEGSHKWSTEAIDNVKEAHGSPEEIKKYIKGCEVAVSGYAPFTLDVMEASPNLRVIGISRGGPVNVDQYSATQRDVIVLKAVGRNAESVADQTMGLILGEIRHIARTNKEIKTGEYFHKLRESGRSNYLEDFEWMEANGKTLGLIGYGQVGSRVARRAKAFDMRVIVYDPYIDKQILTSEGVEPTDLDNLLRNSDFVSIHAGFSPETRHMINADALARMKSTAVLVNTARGSIVDEEALIDALKKGTISSAALDVVETDPIKEENPLIALDNVTLTPHTAGRSPDTEMRGYRQVAQQVSRYLKGEQIQPMYVANKAVLNKSG
jgi:D-3-phosphoglycerate dehydrogenase